LEFRNLVELRVIRVRAMGTIVLQNNSSTSSGCCTQDRSRKSSLEKESVESK